jgi:hypothetical protein
MDEAIPNELAPFVFTKRTKLMLASAQLSVRVGSIYALAAACVEAGLPTLLVVLLRRPIRLCRCACRLETAGGGATSVNLTPAESAEIAVGTAVASRPPHRSVREELPHTAPTLGQTSRLSRVFTALRTTWFCSALSPAHAQKRRLPLGRTPFLDRLRLRESHPHLFACVVGTMGSSDFPTTYTSVVPPVAFTDRCDSLESQVVGISRFSRLEFPDMLRFYDSAVS